MVSDPWASPTGKAWVQHVLDNVVPAMEDSAVVIQLVPDDREGDVKFWVELGASIMLDKPILAVSFTGEDLPPKLLAIADEVVVLERGVNPAASEELAVAIRRLMERI